MSSYLSLSPSGGGVSGEVGASSSSFVFRVGPQEGSIPPVVRQVLIDRGWVEMDERRRHHRPDDWHLHWSSSGFTLNDYASLLPWQRLNHHPQSTTLITRKDRLARVMKRMEAVHGPTTFNFSPFSFLLPTEYRHLLTELRSPSSLLTHSSSSGEGQQRGGCGGTEGRLEGRRRRLWIFKPVDESRGRGIFIFTDLAQLQQHRIDRSRPSIVQQYIPNPLLISRYKFDLRLYVLVASFHPLRLFLHENGLVRFSTDKFDLANLDNTYCHLTNTSINRFGLNYGLEKERVGTGCKWSIDQLRQFFYQSDIDDISLWSQVINIVILTIVLQTIEQQKKSTSNDLRSEATATTEGNCFELYGFDVLIDDQLKPWLLEVNFSPSLNCHCATDDAVKRPMLNDLFRLIESDLSSQRSRPQQHKRSRRQQRDLLPCSRPASANEKQRFDRNCAPMTISQQQQQHRPLVRGNQLKGRSIAKEKSCSLRSLSASGEDGERLDEDWSYSHLERRSRCPAAGEIPSSTRGSYEGSSSGRFIQVFPFNSATHRLSSAANNIIDIRQVAAETRKMLATRNALLTSIASSAASGDGGRGGKGESLCPSGEPHLHPQTCLRRRNRRPMTSEGLRGITPDIWWPLS